MDLINIYKIYVIFQQFYYDKNDRIREKYTYEENIWKNRHEKQVFMMIKTIIEIE